MLKNVLRGKVNGFVDKAKLQRLRAKATRIGVWHRALDRIDKVLVDLVLKFPSDIHSRSLSKSISAITARLERFLANRTTRTVQLEGLALARHLSLIAQKWGNQKAGSWSTDPGFIRYLTVMAFNCHSGSRTIRGET